MFKKLIFLFLLVPLSCLAQVKITGSVISAADHKPVANASVFLSNATIGAKTDAGGNYVLNNIKSGKYELVVSIVGFETYKKAVTVGNENMALPDISISPKTYAINEVVVKQHTDPNRARYLAIFTEQFLGHSNLADQCKILNPELLDFTYDDDKRTLTASSVDFLIIENPALGYRVKYLVTSFTFNDKDISAQKMHYEGEVLFEKLSGTLQQEDDWQKARFQVYKGSLMHFLRALPKGALDENGFRVMQYANPPREGDGKRKKLAPTLLNFPLKEEEIMKNTDQPNVYALGCDFDSFHITYNEDRHFSRRAQVNNMNAPDNHETSILNFNTPYALFDNNGALVDPNSVSYSGAWGNNRVAELLPVDYEPLNIPAANNSPQATDIVNKLKTYNDTHITEKAYLHFDKPYYATGDTVYFKAYTTAGPKHELSTISGVLHVELINPAGKIQQAIALQLNNGIAWGDFALPDTLQKGNYRIRAYTQWMRNSSNFFEQGIKVGALLPDKVPESATKQAPIANNKTDLQFFAEGGTPVTGLSNKIAFKAIAANGNGIDVKGAVFDNNNRQVTSFTSAHLGMGDFMLNPEQGKTYHAVFTDATGVEQSAQLPRAADKGISLAINNDEIAKAAVKITANDAFYKENKDKGLMLLIYTGGTAVTVPCKLDSQSISLDILKRRLKTGITRITLFNDANEPLCERLIFIQNYDQLSFAINTDKAGDKRRGQTKLNFDIKNRAGNPATGHFSVSVVDENKVPVDENAEHTILTNLLLTSDLKGSVEQPNYYFANINAETQHNLDLVMLTNGYRGFEWRPLLKDTYPAIAYQPEKGLSISGIAKTLGGRTLKAGTVSLVKAFPETQVWSQEISNDGSFKFNDLLFTDSGKFILQAINGKGANTTSLIYKKEDAPAVAALPGNMQTDVNLSMADYLENSKLKYDDYLKYNKVKMLKEVKIKAIKRRDDDYRSSSIFGPGNADEVVHIGDVPVTGSLMQMLEVMVRREGARRLLQGNFSGLLMLDGAPMTTTTRVDNPLGLFSASDVETVEFFYGASAAMYGVRGGNGVIVITTKNGGGLKTKDIPSIGILPITVPGFYKARVFYSPKYESLEQNSNRPDLRSTIYWQPELATDKTGHASLSYFNADGIGSYRVVIEGIDEDGNLGRQVYRYDVQ